MVKPIISIMVAVATVFFVSCTSNAQTPKVYGNIDYEGAQLLSAPDAKSKAIGDLLYGEIVEFEPVSDSQFVKVHNIATGAEGYVDTLKINKAQYPLESPELDETENLEPVLLNIETLSGGETQEGWSFWKDGNGVKAFQSIMLVYNTGRSQTVQHYYKGVAKPGYLLLTEEVQYGEDSGEKLETPIVIYEDIAGRAGVFVDGKCFTPNGQLGGFDTDDWE